jgi:hypothetical protein
MAAARTLNVSGAGTRPSPSIGKRIWGREKMSASVTVSRMLDAGRGLLQLLPSGVGLTDVLKRYLLKGTFGPEMHFILE